MSSAARSQHDLPLFQALQRAHHHLWHEVQQAPLDDPDDFTLRFAREETYIARLNELETTTAAAFDVTRQHIREVMLRGILEGWPWRDT